MEQEQREALIATGQQLKERLSGMEARLRDLEAALQAEAQRLPNMTHPDVAIGGEDAAVLLREVGTKPDFAFDVRIRRRCQHPPMVPLCLLAVPSTRLPCPALPTPLYPSERDRGRCRRGTTWMSWRR